jgi:hypothetical protein
MSDQEIREIQAATVEVFPGSLLDISGIVTGCPCEEGLKCSDQVWVVAHRAGHTHGLELSRVNGHWVVGTGSEIWMKSSCRPAGESQAVPRTATVRFRTPPPWRTILDWLPRIARKFPYQVACFSMR